MKSHHNHLGRHKSRQERQKPSDQPFPTNLAPLIPISVAAATHAELSANLPAEVYLIGCGAGAEHADQPSARRIGSKAWNLLRMVQMSLPVPPAFVLGTHYCIDPAARDLAAHPSLWRLALSALEQATGHKFGDIRKPLLLSVRSGAPVSMPGMMETLLNIGLCDATVDGLLRQTGNPRLVWDAYRRLVAAYGEVVAGLSGQLFEKASLELFGERDESDLDFAELQQLTRRYLEVHAQAAGKPFPQDPALQLAGAIKAVLASWQSPKAREYRRLNNIADNIGTAVTVQSMVFGNTGGQSGSGVGFTRDPANGEPALWVDFLFNAQGEDVVSGRRNAHGHDELSAVLPSVWQTLQKAARQLEHAFADMQDFEFTVQEGKLFMLQTRGGKRTPYAAARIALDMLNEGLIDAELANERTAWLNREVLAQPRVVSPAGEPLAPLALAASAGKGVGGGEIALDEARAASRHAAGVPVVLVRRDAETGNIAALESAAGLLTQRGARTSHAAVVARQLGKVCLVGCAELEIDEAARRITLAGRTLAEGDWLTLDGNTGAIYAGAIQTELEYPVDLLERLEALRRGGYR